MKKKKTFKPRSFSYIFVYIYVHVLRSLPHFETVMVSYKSKLQAIYLETMKRAKQSCTCTTLTRNQYILFYNMYFIMPH